MQLAFLIGYRAISFMHVLAMHIAVTESAVARCCGAVPIICSTIVTSNGPSSFGCYMSSHKFLQNAFAYLC